MLNGFDDVLLLGFTGGDHVSFLEFHGLGPRTTELSGDDDLHTLGVSVVHDELKSTIARTSNRKAALQFVANRLSLCSRTETSWLDLKNEKTTGIENKIIRKYC